MRSGAITISDVPTPSEPKRAGVLVRVRASLISAGTEKMKVDLARASLLEKARKRPDDVRKVIAEVRQQGFWSTYERVSRKLDTPGPLGYSCAGEVIAVSEDVDDLRPGDRVACGGQGAYHSEVVSVLRNLCVKIPDSVPFTDACYTTLGAIAMQGLRQANLTFGESVAVIGLGLVGQLACAIASAAGCVVIGIDLDEAHVNAAAGNAQYAFNRKAEGIVETIKSITNGHGVDAILIAAATSSNDPITFSAQIARDRARIVMVGVTNMDIPRDPFYMKELEFKLSRSYGPGRYEHSFEELGIDYPIGYVRWTERRNMQEFVRLLDASKVRPTEITTHRFNIEDAGEAYSIIAGEKKERYLGIVLEYPESESQGSTLPKSSPVVHANELNRSRVIGRAQIGFIGAGNFAQGFLLPTLKSDADLIVVANQSGASAMDAQSKFGFKRIGTASQSVIEAGDVNTVFIATRHGSHADLATKALEAGKNVFVEKPLALNLAQLSEVVRAYDSAHRSWGTTLMVGFNRRFSPLVKRTKEYFADSSEPKFITYRINAGTLPTSHWTQDEEEGGGRIIGEVCHFIDTAGYLTGDAMPRSVSARSIESGRADVMNKDTVSITIDYSDGSVATILYIANGDKALPKEELQVFSNGRTAILKNFIELELWNGAGSKQVVKESGKGHIEEVKAFLKSLQTAGEAPIPFESLVATTAVTFGIRTSLATGEIVRYD